MANLTSTILRDLLEQKTGMIGQSMKNARLRQEERERAQAEAQEIRTKTSDLLVVKSSLATTYKNFQSIEKDLKVLARAMAADIAINTEQNKQAYTETDNSKKTLTKKILQQNKKDDDDNNLDLSQLIKILRQGRRGPKKPGPKKPGSPRRTRPPIKIPGNVSNVPPDKKAPTKVPEKKPVPPQQVERRARTASRNAYNRAIASGLSPEEARIRSESSYNESKRRGQTGEPRNLDLGESTRVRAAEITARENKLQIAEMDVASRAAAMRRQAQGQADDIEKQRKQIATDRANIERQRAQAVNEQANVERQRAQVINDQRSIETLRAQLTQEKIALEQQRASMLQADTTARTNIEAQRASVEAQRASAQADFDQRLKALEVQKERISTIQNDYTRSWAQRHVQLEAQQKIAAQRIVSAASIGSAAVAEAKRVESAASTAVVEHKAEWDRITRESVSIQADLDKEIKSFKAQQPVRVPTPSPTPAPTPTLQPLAPVQAPTPQRVAYVPLNPGAKKALEAFAKNKIVAKISETVYKKLPLIGLVVVGGIATWQLVQGKVAQAAITVAEGFDPTIIGVTAITFLPVLKMEAYFEKHKISYEMDILQSGKEVADQRKKEIDEIVDEQWEASKKEMKESWQKTGDSLKQSWRRDLDRGIGSTLRESVSGQPPRRGRGRNVLPAPGPEATPVQKPGASVLLPRDASVADAIKQAALLTGVDEAILLAMAKQESSFNPNAKAGTSSAKGLFQFLDSTWNDMVKKYGKDYPQLLNGPFDPLASAIAGALYIKENQKILEKSGIPITGSNIYATHFLGPYGAVKLLSANPLSSAADILPLAASANRSVFFNADGTSKTVGQVEEFLYGKVGQQAEQYAALLQQPSTGLALASVSTAVAANQQRGGMQPPVIIERENTRYVSVATNTMSSRRENIPMVGTT